MLTTYKPEPVFTFLFEIPTGEKMSEITRTQELAMMKVSRRAGCTCGELTLLPTPINSRFDWEMQTIRLGTVPAPAKRSEKRFCYTGCGNEATHELWESEDEYITVCDKHLANAKRPEDGLVKIKPA